MKTRDSGMPDQDWWESFFDPDGVLDALGLRHFDGPVVDVGCGYGTFTLAVARRSAQPVIAVDIEPVMVETTVRKARDAGFTHVLGRVADVTEASFGVDPGSAAVVLLFNLLHCEDPCALLRTAVLALRPGGRVAAIHWRSDVPTPRGPDLAIRPRPDTLRGWLIQAGLDITVEPLVLPPYHFGMVGKIPSGA
ncbi:MAG: class I SAM-dependent methyltransferase [Planctomycetes bacterium]|nr:class I SAM-dependent methyltransferase [Planctomycetota bacterium]